MRRRTYPRLRILSLALTSTAALSCHSGPDPRLLEIQKQIQEEQQRLDGVTKEVEEMKKRAKQAREEAAYQTCRGTTARVRAEVARRGAMCAKDVADHNLCLALNSKEAAESTLAGCALGLLFNFFAPGAMPWALGGCALGASSAPTPDCPSTACTDKLPTLQRDVLAELNLASFPHCGGYLGLSPEPWIDSRPSAIRIDRVLPGTTAQSASAAKGDALFAVNGQHVSSAEDIEAALTGVAPGEAVRMSVIREGQWLELTGTASRRVANGEFDDRVRLGIELGDSLDKVPFAAGVQLADVDPQGPTHAGLRAGDKILAVSASQSSAFEPVRSPEALEERLEEVRADQQVTFKVLRGRNELRVEVQAAARGEHAWL